MTAIGLSNQFQLPGHRINGIYDIIIGRKVELIGGFRRIEYWISAHLTGWRNVQNTVFCYHYLFLPQSAVQCNDLPIEIGETDNIVIDEIQCTNAASCQCLHHIAAYTAYPKYCYTCLLKPLERRFSQEQFRP